jgi:hypothetical protein
VFAEKSISDSSFIANPTSAITPDRQSLSGSHRQSRWLTVWSYQYSSRSWVYVGMYPTNLIATHQGPLSNIFAFPVAKTSGLGPGQHVYYFGVDMDMNGVLDLANSYYDHVVVNVK